MEIIESILSMGIEMYLKNEKKKSIHMHFLEETNLQDQYEISLILTHRNLSHYRFLIQDYIKKENISFHKKIHTEWTLESRESFQYLYIFYHESICVYFYGKNGKNYICFEGLHKWSDFKNIRWIRWIQRRPTLSYDIFLQKGTLFKIKGCYMIPKKIDHFWNIFQSIQHKYYHLSHKIPLILEGYSLGGLYLQYFISFLEEKKILDEYEIHAYQLESWFQGSKKEFEEFKQKIQLTNIMKYGSYFHLFNSIFQKYRLVDSFIPSSKDTSSILKSDNPLRMFEYAITSHMI